MCSIGLDLFLVIVFKKCVLMVVSDTLPVISGAPQGSSTFKMYRSAWSARLVWSVISVAGMVGMVDVIGVVDVVNMVGVVDVIG